MAVRLGGASSPHYDLLYENDGSSVAGTTALGAPTWAVSGGAITPSSSSGPTEGHLVLVEGVYAPLLIMEAEVQLRAASPDNQIGFGIGSPDDNDVGIDVRFGEFLGDWAIFIDHRFASFTGDQTNMTAKSLSTWYRMRAQIVGSVATVWFEDELITSRYVLGSGAADALRLAVLNCPTSGNGPLVRNIRAWVADLGEARL